MTQSVSTFPINRSSRTMKMATNPNNRRVTNPHDTVHIEDGTNSNGSMCCRSVEMERPPNPLESASLLSRLTFSWPYALIQKGLKRPIQESDIPEVLNEESSQRNRKVFEKIWQEEQDSATRAKRPPSLHRAVLKLYFSKLWYLQPLIGVTSASRIGCALFLGKLIQTFGEGSSSQGYLWAFLLILSAIVPLLTHHQTYFWTWRMGMQLRIAAIATIYSKTLRLSSIGGSQATSSGQLCNLASNDAERFLYGALFLPYLYWGPVEAIVVLVIGLHRMGVAFAAGYAVLFFVVPLQFVLGNRFATFRSQVAAITDERISLISQVVAGVRVMKMNGWELQFAQKIDQVRLKEINKIQHASRLKAWNEAIYFSTNIVVGVVTFSVHVLLGKRLLPHDVFTTFTLINLVQFTMTKFFAYAVMSASECFVSISRMQQFLEQPEVNTSTQLRTDGSLSLISLIGVTCYWDSVMLSSRTNNLVTNSVSHSNLSTTEFESSTKKPALCNISLDLEAGKLYCIIGPVGSSKSALLQVLSGELVPFNGKIERRTASIAFAAQDPWIINGTIRENIIMGLDFDADRYCEIVKSCGLNPDMSTFPSGDSTVVGDKGVQCSGGQRARIGLARAIYRDADVLLLDDPLSAVDSKVGRQIYECAIHGLCVQRGKCVVLATHQHQFIGEQTCILMNGGQLIAKGPYADCVAQSGGLFQEMLQTSCQNTNVGRLDCTLTSVHESNDVMPKVNLTDEKRFKSPSRGDKKGVPEINVWTVYIAAMGGGITFFLLLSLFAGTQALMLATITQIARWAEYERGDEQRGAIASLGALVFSVVLLSVFRTMASFFLSIKASRRLHDKMTFAVLRSKIQFFDTNPNGHILNRFSSDVGISDDQIPSSFNDTLSMGFIVIGGVVTAAIVMPFLLLAFPPLIFYFFRLRAIFVKVSRELKMIEGAARSPICSMMTESISGIASIRSNGSVEYFMSKFECAHDAHSRAFFGFFSTTRWLNFRLEAITIALLTLASLLAVLVNDRDWYNVNPSTIGLSLTLLLQLSGLLQWFTRQSSELINQMVAIERVAVFTELPSEAPLELYRDENLTCWPTQGRVQVTDLTVRYRSDLPAVLVGVSFDVDSGERVGIVGRTGSGKSTVIEAMFRLLEVETGVIALDGVDTTKVGLHKLRQGMSVIPQTPVLFSGCSIRENLDPFSKYHDTAIMKVLSDVQMMDTVNALPDGIQTMIAEGGSNFSCGEKQLICVARAILQKAKVIVLDEPTANVDCATDALLHRALATSFPGTTVIAVAHRLDTIMDYDKIVVIDGGRLVECGSPHELLEHGEHFRTMVDETGTAMALELRAKAQKHFSSRQSTQ